MKETIVKYETARLLKDVGFDVAVLKYYDVTKTISSQSLNVFDLKNYNLYKGSIFYSAPTQALAQTWLRDNHSINISISFKPNIKKWDFICYDMNMNGKEYVKFCGGYTKLNNNRSFDAYEEALEFGLLEALTLIKTKIL